MSGLEILESVKFVTVEGKRFAAIGAEDWKVLIEWLETLEDLQIVRQSVAELAEAGGDRESAGWLKWDEIAGEIE